MPASPANPPRGRGAISNPNNRFETVEMEWDEELPPEERPEPRTQYLRDASKSIVSTNDSSDVGFDQSVNPYRGCEHGCVYCYARPTHEYLGFSAGIDFETRIMVKENAPELLRAALGKPGWVPKTLAMSGVTDCYQPVERRLRLTRRCLEVLAECRQPVGVITKNRMVIRDMDLYVKLARYDAAAVNLSITSLDPKLTAALEPRTSRPAARLEALRALNEAGVPAGVMVAPIIPGLNDHEIPAILAAAAEAGARWAGFIMMRLPHANKQLFAEWLERHYPARKDRVLSNIRDLRGGELSDARFGSRMSGEGVRADHIRKLFELHKRRNRLDNVRFELSGAHFRPPLTAQTTLFD